MLDDIERVVWDSCVIIDAIRKTEDRYDLIEPFLRQAEKGALAIIVSELTVVEVSYTRTKEGVRTPAEEDVALIRSWFDSSFVFRRNVHPGISDIALGIARGWKIKPADAIVVATAVFEKIPLIHTFDGAGTKKVSGLLKFDGKIGTPPVQIQVPDPAEGTLFSLRNDDTEKASTEED